MSKWNFDNTHSEISFSVKHLMISTVKGNFGTFSADVETEGDDFKNVKITFEADLNSINTKNEQRDGHLKSADFFDAENHPKITFNSSDFNSSTGKLNGELVIRGTAKKVSLDVEFEGIALDFYGNTKAGFSVSGKINRKDFGLHWGAVTEAGSVVVSDEVKIMADVQLVKVG